MVSGGQQSVPSGVVRAGTEVIELVDSARANGVSKGRQDEEDAQLALTLRIRVFQIFCGISCILTACVAFIEEKRFNLAVGVLSGSLTVMAACFSIRSSCADNVYQPLHVQHRHCTRVPLHSLHTKTSQPVVGVAVSWVVASVTNTALVVLAVMTLNRGQVSHTLLILCVLHIVFVSGLFVSALLVLCVNRKGLTPADL